MGVRYLAPDADNDGWRANVDRDDHDPQAGYCPAQPPPPLIVTSTGDSASYPGGQSQPGYTLRCALADANAAGSGKMIAFALSASDPAPRAWFARALWQALDSYFSVNHLP